MKLYYNVIIQCLCVLWLPVLSCNSIVGLWDREAQCQLDWLECLTFFTICSALTPISRDPSSPPYPQGFRTLWGPGQISYSIWSDGFFCLCDEINFLLLSAVNLIMHHGHSTSVTHASQHQRQKKLVDITNIKFLLPIKFLRVITKLKWK